MDHLGHNRRAWNCESAEGGVWSRPVEPSTVARARNGDWQVILTPTKAVPRPWFGELTGKDLLCLASGGGQQAPIFAAAGARVVSFDLSDEQLSKDRMVAERDGLAIRCEQGDMADLGRFAANAFDLVFHPAANVFVPDVLPVWREAFRVLRPGGVLLAGFMNPSVFLFDHQEADASGELKVKYRLPYSDIESLAPDALSRKLAGGEPLEFGHTLEAQIGGQLAAGFLIAGFYEDDWLDDTWQFNRYSPVCIATRAVKPG
jgi:SAM-dependent methyltransferase